MLLVTGEVERVLDRQAGPPGGQQWTERTIVVRDWGQTLYVVAAREFAEAGLPEPGERVVIEAGVKPYAKKPYADGKAGHQITGYRRNSEAETAMFSARSLKAASNS